MTSSRHNKDDMPSSAAVELGRSSISAPTLEEIYDTHFDFVYRSAFALGVREHLIDDVVQDVFFVVHKQLHKLTRPEGIRSWLYAILRRVVLGHARRHRTRREDSLVDEGMPYLGVTPEASAGYREELSFAEKALNKLTPPKREAFVLVDLEQMTVVEVAAALGINERTVYSRVHAARKELRAHLARMKADGQGGRS